MNKVQSLASEIKALSKGELILLEKFFISILSKYELKTGETYVNPSLEEVKQELSAKRGRTLLRLIVLLKDIPSLNLKEQDVIAFKNSMLDVALLHEEVLDKIGASLNDVVPLEYDEKELRVTISMPLTNPYYHNSKIASLLKSNLNLQSFIDFNKVKLTYFDERKVGSWEKLKGAAAPEIGEIIFGILAKRISPKLKEADKSFIIKYLNAYLDSTPNEIDKEIKELEEIVSKRVAKLSKEKGIPKNEIRYASDEDLWEFNKMIRSLQLLLLYKEREIEFWWEVNN